MLKRSCRFGPDISADFGLVVDEVTFEHVSVDCVKGWIDLDRSVPARPFNGAFPKGKKRIFCTYSLLTRDYLVLSRYYLLLSTYYIRGFLAFLFDLVHVFAGPQLCSCAM